MDKVMIKFTIAIISAATLTASIYWLWQRQPNPKEIKTPEKESTASATLQETVPFVTNPQDLTVFTKGQIEVKGKAQPNQLIAVYSNGQQHVTKSNTESQFNQVIKLEPGLNLINVATVATGESNQTKTLTLYLESETESKNVFAGSVKNIFDTLLTVTTASGERNVRTAKSTDFDIPQDEDEKEATATGVKLIRIGDYAIAIGNTTDNDTLLAKSVEILRDNKPQISEQFKIAKIISNVRQNLFSARDEVDSKIVELTLAKSTQIQIDGNKGKSSDIAKDKSAIIFYHPDADKNIADLVYLLP